MRHLKSALRIAAPYLIAAFFLALGTLILYFTIPTIGAP